MGHEGTVTCTGRERPVVRLFGPLTFEAGGRTLGPGDLGGTRPKRVLEILLSARGHPVPTDRLAELLWGEAHPRNAFGSIQTFVSVLRRTLVTDRGWARELVVTEVEAYRFDTGLVDLDLDRFDALTQRAQHESNDQARLLLEEALSLVRGDVLEDEPYAVWAQDARASYRGRVLGAYLDAADAALAEFDYPAALAHAQEATRLDPFSERAQRVGMLALYALGRQHEALDTYRRLRSRLDDELGLEPTAETRALETAILRQEDVRGLVPRPAEVPHSAESRGSVRLLGRTSELRALGRSARQALEGSSRLVLLEGEAGVGKTRLLAELVISLDGVRLGRGSGSPLEQHLPYVPLAEALREALGHLDLKAERPALAPVLPELSLGEVRPGSGHLDALEALADLIAEHGPLLLIVDDLQWADSATIAAISYLQRRRSLPLLVVAAVRSEQAPPDHDARRLRPDEIICLEPLTRAELAPLGMPDLYECTGGNPRFVTETLGDRGSDKPASGFADELLAECRAAGASSYRSLLAASLLRQPFDPEPLATLLNTGSVELAEELERLCERRILAVDGFGFRFRYEPVREALLESLSPARRRLLEERLNDHGLAVHDSPMAPDFGPSEGLVDLPDEEHWRGTRRQLAVAAAGHVH